MAQESSFAALSLAHARFYGSDLRTAESDIIAALTEEHSRAGGHLSFELRV